MIHTTPHAEEASDFVAVGSGTGRLHGPDGPEELTCAEASARRRSTPPTALTSSTRTPADEQRPVSVPTVLHARAGAVRR